MSEITAIPLANFPSVHIMTDDVLGGNQQIASPEPVVTQTIDPTPTGGEPTPPANTQTGTETTQTDTQGTLTPDNTNNDIKDFSQTALFVKLLESEGFGIYEELPKDLTPQQFVQDLPEFISTTVEDRVNERLEKLGSYAEYFKLLDQGLTPEQLSPAYRVQTIADFDVNGNDVTEDHLKTLVVEMHKLRGLTEEEAEQLTNVAKSSNTLKQKAEESVSYHKEYIKHVQQQALADHKAQVEVEQLRARKEEADIVNILKTGKVGSIPITKEDQNKIYDTLYKKNVVVNWVDDKGQQQQGLASKWEVEMHQIMQDPNKLAMLALLVANDFNINSSLVAPIQDNLNKKILDALEQNGGGRKIVTPTTETVSNNVVSRFAPQVVSIGN